MDDEREPNLSEDPREQGTGQGYPESNPAETTPAEGTKEGPEGNVDDEPAPDTHAGQDERPGGATGNPDAAGA